MQMVIGTRKWSSWSMRPWLVARRAGLRFEDILVTLRTPETSRMLEPYSPSAQCPVLIDGDLSVWDSLAVCEYLAEKAPDKALWPRDPAARALARSACAQMHGSFQSLRGGAVVGDHTFILAGDTERIEITHRAQDRGMFATGAVQAALWAKDQPAGFYSMADVLGLTET